MTARQWVTVQFKEWDRRSYTFHNDGEAAERGDLVEVDTRSGPKTAKVLSLPTVAPPFATRPVLRIVTRAATMKSEGNDQ